MNFKLIAGLSLSAFSLSVSNVLSAERLNTRENNIYKMYNMNQLKENSFVFHLRPTEDKKKTTDTVDIEVALFDIDTSDISVVFNKTLEKLYKVSTFLHNLFGDKRLSEDGIHWTKTFITLLKYCAAHENLWMDSMKQMISADKSLSLDNIAKTIEKNPKLEPRFLQHKILELMQPEIANYEFIGVNNKTPFN